MVKKTKNRSSKKKISNEEIFTWTFLFMAIAYGVFRVVRAFEERGIIF